MRQPIFRWGLHQTYGHASNMTHGVRCCVRVRSTPQRYSLLDQQISLTGELPHHLFCFQNRQDNFHPARWRWVVQPDSSTEHRLEGTFTEDLLKSELTLLRGELPILVRVFGCCLSSQCQNEVHHRIRYGGI